MTRGLAYVDAEVAKEGGARDDVWPVALVLRGGPRDIGMWLSWVNRSYADQAISAGVHQLDCLGRAQLSEGSVVEGQLPALHEGHRRCLDRR